VITHHPDGSSSAMSVNNYQTTQHNVPEDSHLSGGNILCYEIHKLIYSIQNKEEFPEQQKEYITEPIYKKGDKSDCSN
jgi:hypothetical protein